MMSNLAGIQELEWIKDSGCIIERVEDSGVLERLMNFLEKLENI